MKNEKQRIRPQEDEACLRRVELEHAQLAALFGAAYAEIWTGEPQSGAEPYYTACPASEPLDSAREARAQCAARELMVKENAEGAFSEFNDADAVILKALKPAMNAPLDMELCMRTAWLYIGWDGRYVDFPPELEEDLRELLLLLWPDYDGRRVTREVWKEWLDSDRRYRLRTSRRKHALACWRKVRRKLYWWFFLQDDFCEGLETVLSPTGPIERLIDRVVGKCFGDAALDALSGEDLVRRLRG